MRHFFILAEDMLGLQITLGELLTGMVTAGAAMTGIMAWMLRHTFQTGRMREKITEMEHDIQQGQRALAEVNRQLSEVAGMTVRIEERLNAIRPHRRGE